MDIEEENIEELTLSDTGAFKEKKPVKSLNDFISKVKKPIVIDNYDFVDAPPTKVEIPSLADLMSSMFQDDEISEPDVEIKPAKKYKPSRTVIKQEELKPSKPKVSIDKNQVKVITPKTIQADKQNQMIDFLEKQESNLTTVIADVVDRQGERLERVLNVQHQMNLEMVKSIQNSLDENKKTGFKIDVIRDDDGFASYYVAYPIDIEK